jgi:Kef-type K+ transport system membrane component KefB
MGHVLPVTDPVIVFAIVSVLILTVPMAMERLKAPGMIGLLLAGAILGPHALHVLERDSSFILLGSVGLLYIMFTAALEVDLETFRRYGVHGAVFGLVTFAIPQGLGTLISRYLLRYTWPQSILLASMFASHTLLAYPIASRLGIVRNRAVPTTVAGTMVTDTLALTVLAIIARTTHGALDEAFWWRLGVSLVIYVIVIFMGVPRLGRWLFREVGADGVAQFGFVLAAVFTCASLSYLAGLEPIVGAFLAGLALNRLIPKNSPLMNRIGFTGEAIFVPFFLISVGMLLDARVLFGGLKTWLIGIVMTGTAIGTKWLAAESTRVLLRFDKAEAGVVFGLSVAQAAATLAAVMVGYELHIFDDAVVNATILMILVTCTLAPWWVARKGQEVARNQPAEEASATEASRQRILVSIPDSAHAKTAVELALLMRDPAQNQPLYLAHAVLDDERADAQLARAEKLLGDAAHHAAAADVPVQFVTTTDRTIGAALLRARRDRRINEVILHWDGLASHPDQGTGGVITQFLQAQNTVVVLARVRSLVTISRVLFAMPALLLDHPCLADAVAPVKRLARQLGGSLEVLTERAATARAKTVLGAIAPAVPLSFQTLEDWAQLTQAMVDRVTEHHLIVLFPSGQDGGGAISPEAVAMAERFPDRDLLVLYPPARRAGESSEAASLVAVGGSSTPMR